MPTLSEHARLSEIGHQPRLITTMLWWHISATGWISRQPLEQQTGNPEAALKPDENHWADLAARYDYIMEHKAILKRLGVQE